MAAYNIVTHTSHLVCELVVIRIGFNWCQAHRHILKVTQQVGSNATIIWSVMAESDSFAGSSTMRDHILLLIFFGQY